MYVCTEKKQTEMNRKRKKVEPFMFKGYEIYQNMREQETGLIRELSEKIDAAKQFIHQQNLGVLKLHKFWSNPSGTSMVRVNSVTEDGEKFLVELTEIGKGYGKNYMYDWNIKRPVELERLMKLCPVPVSEETVKELMEKVG